MAKSALSQFDFSGGINAVASPYLIGPKQCPRIRNLILDEHGALTTRDGYTVQSTGTGAAGPVALIGQFNKTGAAPIPYVITSPPTAEGIIPTLKLYRTDFTPWNFVGDLNSVPNAVTPTPQSLTVYDKEIFIVGADTPRMWDGVSLTPVTATGGQVLPPGAFHGAFHLGSLWLWNTSLSETTLDGPSSLRHSDPANPLGSWLSADQTFLGRGDGQVGMGLSTFTIAETGIAPTQTLVAFKNFSTYQITGFLGLSDNTNVQRVKTDMGCVAPRTIQFISGFGIIRLTHKGFALYDGVEDRIISEEIRPYIFGNESITGLTTNGLDRSWAMQSQNPPAYIVACPVGSVALTRIFIYDLIRRSWTVCDYFEDFQCLAVRFTIGAKPALLAGSASANPPEVYELFKGDSTDDGVPISWNIRTRTFYANSFMRPAYWRRLVADIATDGNENVAFTIHPAGQNAPIRTVINYASPLQSAKWGTAVWSQFVWNGSGLQDARRSVDIMRTSPSIYADLEGEGRVKIRGLEWQVSPKPMTRQVR